MMSLTFGLFTQVSGSGPLGPLVLCLAGVIPFLAHLSLLRVSFWDTAMSVVRRTCGRPRRTRRPRRPSVNFLACVHSRGHSFDHKFMKLCQNVNHHNV